MNEEESENNMQEDAEIIEETSSEPAQMFVREKSAEAQFQKPSFKQKFRDFITECRRVLKVTKKPSRDEFKTIVKISGVGILIIGLIGFVIHFAKELLF
jgi:protein transport protein SEC61 subunit gamma-like protein